MSISEKELNDLEYRQKSREQILTILRNQKDRQKNCPHIMGQTSDHPTHNRHSAFHGLRLWDGEVVGVCSYCQKKISSKNPDDSNYFSGSENWWISKSNIAESGDPRNPILVSEENQEEALRNIKENNDFQLTKDYLWNLSLEEKLLKIDPRNTRIF